MRRPFINYNGVDYRFAPSDWPRKADMRGDITATEKDVGNIELVDQEAPDLIMRFNNTNHDCPPGHL